MLNSPIVWRGIHKTTDLRVSPLAKDEIVVAGVDSLCRLLDRSLFQSSESRPIIPRQPVAVSLYADVKYKCLG